MITRLLGSFWVLKLYLFIHIIHQMKCNIATTRNNNVFIKRLPWTTHFSSEFVDLFLLMLSEFMCIH